jgi:hypothetical protein
MLAEGHPLGALVVVLDPVLWDVMRPVWGTSAVKDMTGMMAELDEKGVGWVVRVKG